MKKSTFVLFGVGVVLISGFIMWRLISSVSNDNKTDEAAQSVQNEALEAARDAISKFVGPEQYQSVLLVAQSQVNSARYEQARSTLERITDREASAAVIKEKYAMILETLRLAGDKARYEQAVGQLRQLAETKADAALTAYVQSLTPAYIEQIFAAPAESPGAEEIP